MNTELLVLKGIVSDLPEEDRKNIEEAKRKIEETVDSYNYFSGAGALALAWVGLERSQEED